MVQRLRLGLYGRDAARARRGFLDVRGRAAGLRGRRGAACCRLLVRGVALHKHRRRRDLAQPQHYRHRHQANLVDRLPGQAIRALGPQRRRCLFAFGGAGHVAPRLGLWRARIDRPGRLVGLFERGHRRGVRPALLQPPGARQLHVLRRGGPDGLHGHRRRRLGPRRGRRLCARAGVLVDGLCQGRRLD